jgi:ATP synthase F1 gamma subunit
LHKKKTPISVKKTLIVPITSDKGLCGGTNSSIVREVKAMVKNDRAAFKIFCIGDKGATALTRPLPDLIEFNITHMGLPLNFPTGTFCLISASSIAAQVLDRAKDMDKIVIVYNEFVNVITQHQRKNELMNRK